jgi:hypothetical protein
MRLAQYLLKVGALVDPDVA